MENDSRFIDRPDYGLSLNDDKQPLLKKDSERKSCGVPMRLLLSITCFFGLGVNYMMRVNVSTAIVPMAAEYHWDSSNQGLLLSSFFIGYMLNQVGGGLLAKKHGAKFVFAGAMFFQSIFTILVPLAAFNYWLLFSLRIATGLAGAVCYPAVHQLISEWFPESERSRAVGFIWSGANLGTISSMFFAPHIIMYYNWRFVFYIYGALGLTWSLFWSITGSSTPLDSKLISAEERVYILQGLPKNEESHEIPWKQIFTSAPIWALIVNAFCQGWGFYVLLMWLPTYMQDKLNFDIHTAGIASFLPYVALFLVTMCAGRIADYLLLRNLNRTYVRKGFQIASSLIPCIALSSLCSEPSRQTAVLITIAAVGFSGASVAGYGANLFDVAPHHAGIILGVVNSSATIPGFVGVTITGYVLQATNSWCDVFLMASVFYFIGMLAFVIFATGKRVI